MRKNIFVAFFVILFIKSIKTFAQGQTDSLKLESLSIKEILKEDAKAVYLLDKFERNNTADSTIIEIYFKNEKIISCNKKSVYFINIPQFTLIKREVFTYKGKRILKMIYVKE